MSRFLCEPLAKHHDRKLFDCGEDELNEYLCLRATQDIRRRVAALFVMSVDDDSHRIAGYYTLSSASILLHELPDEIARKLPRYPAVPAVLIGRLARDIRFRGVGRLLLLDALARALHHSREVATTVVLVDVKNDAAQQFYSRYDFQELSPLTKRMFLPMKTGEKLLS
jgi:GNAT superfamily N-acetyltransferase